MLHGKTINSFRYRKLVVQMLLWLSLLIFFSTANAELGPIVSEGEGPTFLFDDAVRINASQEFTVAMVENGGWDVEVYFITEEAYADNPGVPLEWKVVSEDGKTLGSGSEHADTMVFPLPKDLEIGKKYTMTIKWGEKEEEFHFNVISQEETGIVPRNSIEIGIDEGEIITPTVSNGFFVFYITYNAGGFGPVITTITDVETGETVVEKRFNQDIDHIQNINTQTGTYYDYSLFVPGKEYRFTVRQGNVETSRVFKLKAVDSNEKLSTYAQTSSEIATCIKNEVAAHLWTDQEKNKTISETIDEKAKLAIYSLNADGKQVKVSTKDKGKSECNVYYKNQGDELTAIVLTRNNNPVSENLIDIIHMFDDDFEALKEADNTLKDLKIGFFEPYCYTYSFTQKGLKNKITAFPFILKEGDSVLNNRINVYICQESELDKTNKRNKHSLEQYGYFITNKYDVRALLVYLYGFADENKIDPKMIGYINNSEQNFDKEFAEYAIFTDQLANMRLPIGTITIRKDVDVDVRENPESGAQIVGTALKGKKYPLMSISENGWYEIQLEENVFGYIRKKMGSKTE